MSGDVQSAQAERLRLLDALYEKAGGSTRRSVDIGQLAQDANLSKPQSQRALEYLIGEKLVEYVGLSSAIVLTHAGLLEIEKSQLDPGESTEHFGARYNILYVTGGIHGSAIQQGNVSSDQRLVSSWTKNDVKALAETLTMLRNALPSLHLSEADRAEADAEIVTVEAQVGSSRPKWAFVKSSLTSLMNILRAAGPSASQAAEIVRSLEEIHNQLPGL